MAGQGGGHGRGPPGAAGHRAERTGEGSPGTRPGSLSLGFFLKDPWCHESATWTDTSPKEVTKSGLRRDSKSKGQVTQWGQGSRQVRTPRSEKAGALGSTLPAVSQGRNTQVPAHGEGGTSVAVPPTRWSITQP